jgi:hypothetical protein
MTRSGRALSIPTCGKRERKLRAPGPRVRATIDLMVWQGHHRDEAANLAGIKPKSLYNAFGKHRRVEAMSESVGRSRGGLSTKIHALFARCR